MRRILLISSLSALAAVPAVALASGSSKQVQVTDCNRALYKPQTIVLACGDGNMGLVNLKWSRWSQSHASGSGVYAYNTCTPSCASGRLKRIGATVTLSKPIRCKHASHEVFDKANVRYRGKRGPYSRQTFTLGCPMK